MRYLVAVLVAVSASMAFGYTGATVSVFENDNAVANASVFAVPAAAAMTSPQLVYDNSATLPFSAGWQFGPQRNVLALPLISAGVTINNVNVTSPAWGSSVVAGVNNALGGCDGVYFTSIYEAATDPRFPAGIPRPGRDCDAAFSSLQFVLTQPTTEFGVFITRNTNAWSYVDWNTCQLTGEWTGDVGMPLPDDNNILFSQTVFVGVLGETDTFATAQYVALDIQGAYAPFIKVASNGQDKIKSVCVFEDASWQSAPSFGFFDVYVAGAGLVGDVNGDGCVDVVDLLYLVDAFGSVTGDANYDAACDFNSDGSVDVIDLLYMVETFGTCL
jgi:hypothetical protein